LCLITVAFTKCAMVFHCALGMKKGNFHWCWYVVDYCHGHHHHHHVMSCHVHSSYIIWFWCYNDCHLLVPKHHSFLSIYHPPVSCRLIIATSFPLYQTSMDTHISLWLRYLMHYSFYGLCVMCCTYPTTIDFMFCIWLLFYTRYFCYSFILTLFMPDTVADLK